MAFLFLICQNKKMYFLIFLLTNLNLSYYTESINYCAINILRKDIIMKRSRKQALTLISLIVLLFTTACNSLSPIENPSNEYSHAHAQYDTSYNSEASTDPTESMDMSAEASEEVSSADESEMPSDEPSEESSEEPSEEPSEESSEPETDQQIEEILRVKNGTDFTFEDGELRFVNAGPAAFFVDNDETIWIFDVARDDFRILVYKDNSLLYTIPLPEYKEGGEPLMYGDDNNIYIANEPNVAFKIDGTIRTINKITHEVSSDIYWAIPEGYLRDYYKMCPHTFLTINDNIYLTCLNKTIEQTGTKTGPNYAYYKIENGHVTEVTQPTYYIDDMYSESGLFEFCIPENIHGAYDTPSDSQYIKMLRVTDDGWTVMNANGLSCALFTIYRYNSAGKLLGSAYTLRTVDMYYTTSQDYCVARNNNIYRMETADGKDFSGMTVSRITLGTRTHSSEELYKIESDYFNALRNKDKT